MSPVLVTDALLHPILCTEHSSSCKQMVMEHRAALTNVTCQVLLKDKVGLSVWNILKTIYSPDFLHDFSTKVEMVLVEEPLPVLKINLLRKNVD